MLRTSAAESTKKTKSYHRSPLALGLRVTWDPLQRNSPPKPQFRYRNNAQAIGAVQGPPNWFAWRHRVHQLLVRRKNLGAAGDGGMIRHELRDLRPRALRTLRNHVTKARAYQHEPGWTAALR